MGISHWAIQLVAALLIATAAYIFWKYATPNAPPNGMEAAVLFIGASFIVALVGWISARFRKGA